MVETGDERAPLGDASDDPLRHGSPLDFGDQIAVWRQDRGLTVDEVAERADVSAELVEQIELSDHEVGIFDIFRVARALGLKAATFDFGFDQERAVTRGMLFMDVEFEDDDAQNDGGDGPSTS